MIILALDQSYAATGMVVISDKSILFSETIRFLKEANFAKREKLRQTIKKLVKQFSPELIIVERVRLFSYNHVSLIVIRRLSELVALVVDSAQVGNSIPVKSVDTRSWKKAILGRASAQRNDVIKFAIGYGISDADEHMASALCMALSYFVSNVNFILESV